MQLNKSPADFVCNTLALLRRRDAIPRAAHERFALIGLSDVERAVSPVLDVLLRFFQLHEYTTGRRHGCF